MRTDQALEWWQVKYMQAKWLHQYDGRDIKEGTGIISI